MYGGSVAAWSLCECSRPVEVHPPSWSSIQREIWNLQVIVKGENVLTSDSRVYVYVYCWSFCISDPQRGAMDCWCKTLPGMWGLSFDSPFLSPLLLFCLVFLLSLVIFLLMIRFFLSKSRQFLFWVRLFFCMALVEQLADGRWYVHLGHWPPGHSFLIQSCSEVVQSKLLSLTLCFVIY